MTRVLGLDGGNNAVKIYGELGEMMFPSTLGEYRERNLDSQFTKDDMLYEFEGKKGFAGTLAQYESEFASSRLGDSKAHEEFLIRVLLALHRYSDDTTYKVVVGQPVKRHTDAEKLKMKEMLEGSHEFTLNGVTKVIEIEQAVIAPEGGAAFWSAPRSGKVRILDFGSGTVNGATLIDGRYVDRDSFTLSFGLNTILTDDVSALARQVAIHALKKWSNEDRVLVCGGGAECVLEYLRDYFDTVDILKPRVDVPNEQGGATIRLLPPVYANAVGFFKLAKKAFSE